MLFVLHGIDKQNLVVKIMLGFLDLVIWQTFSQGPVKLAYGFKENDLPRVIASNKIEISSKTYSSGEHASITGDLGSFP